MLSDHNSLILLSLSSALSVFYQDVQDMSIRSTDTERFMLSKMVYETYRHTFSGTSFLHQDITFSACFSFFYKRSVEFWQSKSTEDDPKLSLFLEEMTLVTDKHMYISAYATHLLLSGRLEDMYPLPLGLREGDDRILLALLIALDCVFEHYPLSDPRMLEESIRGSMRSLRMQKNASTTLLHSDDVFEQIVVRCIQFALALTDFLLEHRHAAILLRHHQLTSERVQWLACHLSDYDSIPARSLQQVIPFSDPVRDIADVLLGAKRASCLVSGCMKRARPAALLEIGMNPKPFYASLMACSEHRSIVIQTCTGTRVLDAAHRAAEHLQRPLRGIPQMKYLPAPVSHRDAAHTFSTLIEQFRIKNRQSPLLLAAGEIAGDQGVRFVEAFFDALVDHSSKAFVDASASAMAMCLPWLSNAHSAEKAIRYGPHIIGLQEPISTVHGLIHGFSLSQYRQELFDAVQRRVPLGKRALEQLRTAFLPAEMRNAWGLDIFDENGETIYSLSLKQKHQKDGTMQHVYMVHDRVRTCLNEDCGEGHLCLPCVEEANGYLGLYANLIRIISREVSDTESPVPFRKETERVTRKEPDPTKSHKLRDKLIEHNYCIVTFNAAVAPASAGTNASKQHRGSWLARINPETIWWEEKTIGKGTHRLRHARYHRYILEQGGNPDDPDGFPLEVNAHKRRVPCTLKHLRTVKHVIFEVPGEYA